MYEQDLEVLLVKLNIFKKAYDNIRLVDPLNKKVINLHDNTMENSSLQCFDFWGKNKICDNCVSIRAFNDNKTYIKMEYTINEIFMVTAIPIEMSDRRVIIELMKNATNSLVLDSNEKDKQTVIYSMINNLNMLALKDSLTGTYNRRFINEKLPVNLMNAIVQGSDLSIIMADIDFFKKVNDTYGHIVGDNILIRFAETLTQSLKGEEDWVARYGGEEFLICLPGVDAAHAFEIAEEIRRNIEQNTFTYEDTQFKITSSFGIGSMIHKTNVSMDELIEIADKKLYTAKNNGRNRVEM